MELKDNLNLYISGKMPKPRPERGGSLRLAFWALVALLFLGAIAYLLFSGPEKREAMRDQAAEAINDLASGTPLAGIGNIIRQSPPPLPPEIVNPPTASGTLSGRQVIGTIASPMDTSSSGKMVADSGASNGALPNPSQTDASLESKILNNIIPGRQDAEGKPVFSSEPLPPATEDSRVKPGYLAELANWLAARYRTGSSGGTLELSPQALNNLCGVAMAGQMQGGRGALLRYAFQPSMLTGLYKLYIGQFMNDLNAAATQKGFNVAQNRDFHQALAGKAAAYANAMSGILQIPDLADRLNNIESLGHKSVEENAQLANAVFELDELKEQKAASTQINTAQMRITGITARYRRAVEEHEAAQRSLAAAIRKEAGPGLDEESLLFMAAWVQRRLSEDASARSALQTSADIMRDLAKRCQDAGNGQ